MTTVILSCPMFAAEFIEMESLDKTARSLIQCMSKIDDIDIAKNIITKYLYNPKLAPVTIDKMIGQISQNEASIKESLGTATREITMLGSKIVGNMVKVLYFQKYEFMDIPYCITYYKADGGFKLFSVAWGWTGPVTEDLKDFTKMEFGKIPDGLTIR